MSTSSSYDSDGDPTFDPDQAGLDPVLTQTTTGPSPQDEQQATISQDRGIMQRLAQAEAAGPTIRQRTQSEIIDLSLLRNRLGNPFSIRWIPFEQLRDMTTDLMLAYGWWVTLAPIMQATYVMQSPDAQLAAAVDEAYRQVHTDIMMAMSNAMWFGHQPLVKQFKLGRLGSTYRDPDKDINQDIPVWTSSADALLWKAPVTLNPSHCLPSWNDDGQMTGFKFSNTPIPHFDLISAASAYGYEVIPGHEINSDYAVWIVNEPELEFGNVFGSARTKRAYPYWWSYWFRYHIADRSYETNADPPKYVYYPVDFDQFIDPDDPTTDSPITRQARQTAIDIGNQMRSGATIAFPGSFAEGTDGKPTGSRKWEAGYFNPPNTFTDLDASLRWLDTAKLQAWFAPPQAYTEGIGSRTSGGSSGGTGGARMASALSNSHIQSQQPLVDSYDAYVNDHWIPQFIAANFPEKAGIPCRKETRELGQADSQTLSQVLQLVGQVRGEVIPVDIRAVLEQMNIPLLNQQQMTAEIAEISKLAQMMGPPETAPSTVGVAGYNAGVGKTPTGETFYYQPPQRFNLAESDNFMQSLPDTPHFQEAGVRSALIRLRKLFLQRYKGQYQSFAQFLDQQPTLHLAQSNSQSQQSGLDKSQASSSAAAIVGAWAASNSAGAVGSPAVFTTGDGFPAQVATLLTKIALDGGKVTLKKANLAAEDFDSAAVTPWVNERVSFAMNSIDQTVRQEVQNWLADELQTTVDPAAVSKAAQEHFEDFPTSHADRVSRTETANSFNRGTVEASERAGVSQMQLHDASDGNDTQTDSPCLSRNGRVVSTAQAKTEQLNHPNCTLAMTPVTTENLSVEHVESLPTELSGEGKHVAYDAEKEILYLDHQVDEKSETAILLMLGDQIKF